MSSDEFLSYDERYRAVYALGARTWRAPEVDAHLAQFLGRQALPPGDAIDLGCGEGIDAIWLAAQGWRVSGLDVSPAAIGRARELADEAGVVADFRVGDARDLSAFGARSFDLAVSVFSLHMLLREDDRLRMLREARRVLRRHGWLFLDNLARSRTRDGRALPPGQLSEYEVTVGGQQTRVTLPAVPSMRFADQQLRHELEVAGFEVARLYRAGPRDYRRIICWAQKPATAGR